MPKAKEKPEPTTVFQANLRAIIGEESVNAWAKRHTLEQTTIQRLYDGSDPKLSMIEKIAERLRLQPWQLLAPNLQLNNPPIIQGAGGVTEVMLWRRIEELLGEVKGLREGGTTRPGELDDVGETPPAAKKRSRGVRGVSAFGELDEAAEERAPSKAAEGKR